MPPGDDARTTFVATMESDTHAYDQIEATTGFLVFVYWQDASWY
jgi:hypothetical protein